MKHFYSDVHKREGVISSQMHFNSQRLGKLSTSLFLFLLLGIVSSSLWGQTLTETVPFYNSSNTTTNGGAFLNVSTTCVCAQGYAYLVQDGYTLTSFQNSLPPGAVVSSIDYTLYGTNCTSGSMDMYLNGSLIKSDISLTNSCNCSDCYSIAWTVSGENNYTYCENIIKLLGKTGNMVPSYVTMVIHYTTPSNNFIQTSGLASSDLTLCPTEIFDVDFTLTGTYNNGNLFTAQLSDANGDFTNYVSIGSISSTASATISCAIPANTPNGSDYRVRVVSSNPVVIGCNNMQNITVQNTNCSYVDVTSLSQPTLCAGTSLDVDYNSVSINGFNSGNIYSVILSDQNGSFTNSTSIGSLSSTVTSGTINCTIPLGLAVSSSNYLIRIDASNPEVTGTTYTSGLTLNSLSDAGTASSNQSICPNTSANSNLILSNYNGLIQWQYSNDNATWSNINGATSSILTTTQMGGNLSATKYFKALVTNGNCNTEISNTVTITVEDNTVPVSPTLADVTGECTATAVFPTTSDACSGTITGTTSDALTYSTQGTHVITWNFDDGNGNDIDVTQNVVIDDVTNPVLVVQNITVQLDATGNISIAAADLVTSAADNCSIQDTTLSVSLFDCSDIGANSVNVTLNDVNGNSTVLTATVTVADTISPTVVTQNITVYLDATGSASIAASEVDNGSNDNCDIDNLSLDFQSFDCNDVGANTVILSVTDINGNTSTSSSTVLVEDRIPPVAICQNVIVQLDKNGNGSTTAALVNNGSTDVCGIASLSLDRIDFTSIDIGDNTVTLTVVDTHGNSSTCTAFVTVVDNTPPVLICNSIDLILDTIGEYFLTETDILALSAGTTDNSSSALRIQARQISFYCEDVGEVKVDLVAEDKAGNRSYCRTIVQVIDTAQLQITQIDDVVIELEAGVCETQIVYPDVVSSNACSTVSQTAGLGADGFFPVGTTIETWKVTNTSGDEVTMSFNVIVTSVNAVPTIDSIADLEADENMPVVNVPLTGISFGVDCVEQDLSLSALTQNVDLIAGIVVNYSSPDSTGSLDISLVNDEIGNDTITVTVTDSEGVMVSETFVLTINPINKQPTIDAIADLEVEEDSPVITIPLSSISYGNDLEMQDITVSATGTNPALVSGIIVNYASPETTGSIDLTIEPDRFGEETITITVTDNLGASISETFTLTVSPVNDAPYLILPLPDGAVNASYSYELPLTALMGFVFDDIDDDMLAFDVKEEGTDGLPAWALVESGLLTALPMIADTGSYSFVVTASDTAGATASDTFMLVVEGYPTAIGDFDQEKFEVIMYPNPSKGEVNLKINSLEIEDTEVVVRSITGSEVFRKEYKTSEQIRIDLSEQVSGIYLITLKQGNNSVIKKLILDRK